MINRAEVLARILTLLNLSTDAQTKSALVLLLALDNNQLLRAEQDLIALEK